MLAASIPLKFPLTFAQNAIPQDIRVIPTASQIGIQAGAASLNDGFPPVCFLPTTSGGVPPFGQDVNGILNQLSAWCQWMSAGGSGVIPYDASFSTSIGGYPNGALLSSTAFAGDMWVSTADNNTSNPDAGGANWQRLSPYGTFTTGDVKLTIKTVADVGWLLMNDGTIGSASSGATSLAAATTVNLFTLLYNNTTDSNCPLYTSGGVLTTRGAQGTAATAFANNCRMSLPQVLGRALASAGAGNLLTSRALASAFGEENHTLSITEMPSHNHTGSGNVNDPSHSHLGSGNVSDPTHQHAQQSNTMLFSGGSGALQGAPNVLASGGATQFSSTGVTVPSLNIIGNFTGVTVPSLNINNTGGGGSHNNIQPSAYLNVMIKL